MANKVSVPKTKGSSRYLRGLSIVEMEDTEEAVEQALENPSGTFAMVSKEQSYKLSSVIKTLKSVSADTKYIRKIVDKISETLYDIKGSGSGDSGIGSTAATGTAGVAAAKKLAAKMGLSGKALSKALSTTAMTSIISGLAVNDSIDDTVISENADKRQQSRDLRKQYGDNIIREARKRYQPWWRMSSLDTEDINDAEYVKKYLIDEAAKNPNKILKKIKAIGPIKKAAKRFKSPNKQLNINSPGNFSIPNNVLGDISPTERAILIRDRLRPQTNAYGYDMGPYGTDISSLQRNNGFSGGGGSTGETGAGGGGGGGGGGGWGGSENNTTTPIIPNVPSLTPGEFRALEKDFTAGYADNSVKAPQTGKYRPVRELSESDLSDNVVNVIAGEARLNDQKGVDAVINVMMNRLGTTGYGPSGSLNDVAMAKNSSGDKQFAGYRKATPEQAAMIRERIKKIASGTEPDITNGANEYRAATYTGPWAQKHPEKINIGGNNFAKNYDTSAIGPYAPFKEPIMTETNTKINDSDVLKKIANQTPGVSVTETTGNKKMANNTNYEEILKKYDLHPDRKGSITEIKPEMQARVGALFRDAPDYVKKELRIVSGHRDAARQAELYSASGGSGMVAKHSKHTEGTAVDFGAAGAGTAGAGWHALSPETKKWVIENAPKYGLYQPLQPGRTSITEDWHFEPIGNRSGQKNQPVADVKTWKDPGIKEITPVEETKQATVVPKKTKEIPLVESAPGKTNMLGNTTIEKNNKEDMYSQSRPVLAAPVYPSKQLIIDDSGKPRAGYETGKSFDETHSLFKDGSIISPPKAKQANDIVPEKEQEAIRNMVHNAQDLANSALREAKEATKKLTDLATGSSQQKPAQLSNTNIPKNSKNPAPLSNPPKTFLKSTGATNPTQKTPGSDTAKQIPPADTTTMWKETNEPISI
jgi:LAS superfamily LD-carboxypeptidase LdcB/uncharacterized membrane protein YgcG